MTDKYRGRFEEWNMRWLIVALVLLAGCGSGSGGGGNSLDQMAGNWTGTWRNAEKGLSGTLTGTYTVTYTQEPIIAPGGNTTGHRTVRKTTFDGVLFDNAKTAVFKVGDYHGAINPGWVSLYSGSAQVATGPGFEYVTNTPYTEAIFTADNGAGDFAGSKFEAVLTKAP
jgi:hypothetical protein